MQIKVGLKLRPHQEYISAFGRRFNVAVCHRRFGKTHYALDKILKKGFSTKNKSPTYVYIAPTFSQAKRICWTILKEMIDPFPDVETNEADLRAKIPRPGGDFITIILLGSENPNTIRGMRLDGAVFDEYQLQKPSVWNEVVRPALSDRKGWADFIGTPAGSNHFEDLYRMALEEMKDPTGEWAAFLFKASKTGIIEPEELESLKKTMTEDAIAQELECSFGAALQGSYYAKIIERMENDGQIGNVPYDPALPVYTAWDLGLDDSTSIWFIQYYRGTYRIIDYYENSGYGLDHYVKVLKEKPYSYEEHFLPHDAAARELGTGVTRQETLRTLGLSRTRIAKKQSVEDGINAVRLLLPKCWFDAGKCAFGIKALKNYQRKWNEDRQVWENRPLHDQFSHCADAFRTFAMSVQSFTKPDTKNLPRQSIHDYNVLD